MKNLTQFKITAKLIGIRLRETNMTNCNNDQPQDQHQINAQDMQHMGRIIREYTKLKMRDGVSPLSIRQMLMASIERGQSDYYKEAGIDDPNATQEIPAVKADDTEPSDAFKAGYSLAVGSILRNAHIKRSQTTQAVDSDGMADVLRDS